MDIDDIYSDTSPPANDSRAPTPWSDFSKNDWLAALEDVDDVRTTNRKEKKFGNFRQTSPTATTHLNRSESFDTLELSEFKDQNEEEEKEKKSLEEKSRCQSGSSLVDRLSTPPTAVERTQAHTKPPTSTNNPNGHLHNSLSDVTSSASPTDNTAKVSKSSSVTSLLVSCDEKLFSAIVTDFASPHKVGPQSTVASCDQMPSVEVPGVCGGQENGSVLGTLHLTSSSAPPALQTPPVTRRWKWKQFHQVKQKPARAEEQKESQQQQQQLPILTPIENGGCGVRSTPAFEVASLRATPQGLGNSVQGLMASHDHSRSVQGVRDDTNSSTNRTIGVVEAREFAQPIPALSVWAQTANGTSTTSTATTPESPTTPTMGVGVGGGSVAASRADLVVATHDGEDEGDEECGWLCLKPRCLQKSRTAKWVLFWLCWAAAVQGMVVNGFVNVCITTIEKRYDLTSTDTGLIAGAYDMASLVCAIPVSYFGSRSGASKPRWLGWGVFIMGLGSFVFAIPHFSSAYYEGGSDSTANFLTCLRGKSNEARCNLLVENQISSFKYIFVMAQLLHGIGASPLYTLGVTFLDESVPVRMSSVYLGIFFAMAVVGPAAGFVLGGQFLKIYIDAPNYPQKVGGIQESSDLWLGAWWIGFILSGAISMIVSWPLMAFPSTLPGAKALASERESEAYGGTESGPSTGNAFGRLRDLPGASKILAGNPTFVALSLAGATEGTLLAGFATFMPKFIESQFSIQASFAAIIVGFIAVPAGGGGTLIGGWLVKKLNLRCAGILKLCIGFSFVCLLSCFTFFISCPNLKFAGVNMSYENRSASPSAVNLVASCNKDCGCQDMSFDPVCGVNGITYFSPCHAGCTLSDSVKGIKVYSNCSCVPPQPNTSSPLYSTTATGAITPSRSSSNSFSLKSGSSSQVGEEYMVEPPTASAVSSGGGTATRQKCLTPCSLMPVFLVIFFVVMLITFTISLPALSGTLRCVPATHRSFALGLQWIVVRLLGTIPGPILFGALIDNTCMLWQENCGKKGSCRTYDNLHMSRYMMSISIIAKALSTILFFTSWWFYVPPQGQASEKAEGTVSPEHAKEFRGHDNPAMEM